MPFQPVTHCIFDVDGLLLDTETAYFNAYKSIAAKYDKDYPLNVRMKLMGTLERESARIMVEELYLPITVDEFIEEQGKALVDVLPKVDLMPGAERLVRHLHRHGIPIAVATSSGDESMELKTARHKELMSLFHHAVCGASDPEVAQGKPNPDVYLVCASRFDDKPDPKMCLAFEDSPNGVASARAAGMQVVMVPDDEVQEDKKKNATCVFQSLEDFRPELFGLPPF